MSKKPEFRDQNIIVGVDDGFAMTKLVVMQGGSIIKQLMIPSRARSGIHGTTSIGAAAQGEIEARYETEGNTFTVQDLSDAESARFDEYPFSPMNRAIITHALRVAGLGGKEVTVATGLPLSMYYRGSEADEAVLTRKKDSLNKPVKPLDGSDVANILRHEVFPEGLAAWVDYAVDEQGRVKNSLDEAIGIIDIGGRTTDIAVVLPGRMIDHARCGSADLGVLNVIEEVAISIKKEFNVVMGADKIEPALRTRIVKQWGKEKDIGHMIDAAALSVIGAITREVNRRLSNAVDLDKILLVGGGAHLFRGVASAFPNIEIPLEPEFANARGFAKYLAL